MPNLLGTAPNQVPTNADLGKLAFMDVVDTVTNNPYVDTAISDTKPSLLLDFANSKTLDPRITYTRASTATYYDGKTTSLAEQNLLTYSQDFSNAAWTKTSLAVTANSTTAPDGTTTASTVTASAVTANPRILQGTSPVTGSHTVSLYVKAGTYNFIQINNNYSGSSYANFNVTLGAGAVGTKGAAASSSSIIDVGNGWYRCVVTFDNSDDVWISLVPSASATYIQSGTYVGTETVYIWGAQLEQRSSVTAYTPTTSSPITNYIPALQTAAAGVPRFDHDPVTGESKGFLIEEQRSNLVTYSSAFDNAAWVKINATVIADSVVAPDGTLTGDKWIANSGIASGGSAECYQYVATAAGTYTYSLYLKQAGFSSVTLAVRDHSTSANFARVTVSLTDGLISSVAEVGGTFTSPNAKVTQVGNGWYMVALTFSSGAASALRCRLWQQSGTGDGYSGLYIWGAQLEAGSFATSYIPTTSAQVTRSADAASITGGNFSSWYNQAEGSIYTESIAPQGLAGFPVIYEIDDGTVSNRIAQYYYTSGQYSDVKTGGTVQAGQSLLYPTVTGALYKNCNCYKSNDFNISTNGGLTVIDASGAIPSGLNTLRIGSITGSSQILNGTIKKLAYYPKRLSDAELMEMTL